VNHLVLTQHASFDLLQDVVDKVVQVVRTELLLPSFVMQKDLVNFITFLRGQEMVLLSVESNVHSVWNTQIVLPAVMSAFDF
jgi:hypothetical protein